MTPSASRPRLRRQVTLALATLGLVMSALTLIAGAAVHASVGCGTCHAMRPFTAAHSDGAHADVACAGCHTSGGVLALPADGLRAAGWMTAALAGRTPVPSAIGDGACVDCHDQTIAQTVVSRGVAVRHADFAGQACDYCHAGSAHRVQGRHYRVLEMEDCMVCHRTAADDPATCDLCHVGSSARREGSTSWRSTHGAGWETTHGMGETDSCAACHAPRFCIACHGVRLPHPIDWPVTHGAAAMSPPGERCTTCHGSQWCDACHGLAMPHPGDFLAGHGPVALDVGEDACVGCHSVSACDRCHFASSHPNVSGVGMGHEW